jgi:hypothetical protein
MPRTATAGSRPPSHFLAAVRLDDGDHRVRHARLIDERDLHRIATNRIAPSMFGSFDFSTYLPPIDRPTRTRLTSLSFEPASTAMTLHVDARHAERVDRLLDRGQFAGCDVLVHFADVAEVLAVGRLRELVGPRFERTATTFRRRRFHSSGRAARVSPIPRIRRSVSSTFINGSPVTLKSFMSSPDLARVEDERFDRHGDHAEFAVEFIDERVRNGAVVTHGDGETSASQQTDLFR